MPYTEEDWNNAVHTEPDDSRYVIVYSILDVITGEGEITFGYKLEGSWFREEYNEEILVSHWMNKPPAPKM